MKWRALGGNEEARRASLNRRLSPVLGLGFARDLEGQVKELGEGWHFGWIAGLRFQQRPEHFVEATWTSRGDLGPVARVEGRVQAFERVQIGARGRLGYVETAALGGCFGPPPPTRLLEKNVDLVGIFALDIDAHTAEVAGGWRTLGPILEGRFSTKF